MATTDLYITVVIDGGGAGVATITPRARQTWVISQVSVEEPTAPIGATCELRKNGFLVSPLIATGDAATGDPPVTLRLGERLTVEFAGCTPGAVAAVYVIYDDGVSE